VEGLISIWNKRWFMLREGAPSFLAQLSLTRLPVDQLSWHRNENTYTPLGLLAMNEIQEVSRTDAKQYCLQIVTRGGSHYYMSLRSDDELYSWMDELQKVASFFFSLVFLVFLWLLNNRLCAFFFSAHQQLDRTHRLCPPRPRRLRQLDWRVCGTFCSAMAKTLNDCIGHAQ